jgi:hypothetical protein
LKESHIKEWGFIIEFVYEIVEHYFFEITVENNHAIWVDRGAPFYEPVSTDRLYERAGCQSQM